MINNNNSLSFTYKSIGIQDNRVTQELKFLSPCGSTISMALSSFAELKLDGGNSLSHMRRKKKEWSRERDFCLGKWPKSSSSLSFTFKWPHFVKWEAGQPCAQEAERQSGQSAVNTTSSWCPFQKSPVLASHTAYYLSFSNQLQHDHLLVIMCYNLSMYESFLPWFQGIMG